MKTNLSLIGFMGVGKTTIGRVLAKKLDMNFIDIDREIERIEARSIAEIFSSEGEKYFRELERKVILQVENKSNTIISTGGGVILNADNISSLHKHSDICLIECDINLIYQRILRKKAKRPILNCSDAFEKISTLLESRHLLYNNSCDFKIINANEGINEIADKIKNIYIKMM